MIGIRCERGSHRFFKKYGERFDDSEGKQIFLEFADEEREHLDLLVREYRALVKRQGRARRAATCRPAGRPPRAERAVTLRACSGSARASSRADRSPSAYDRVGRPMLAGGARRRAPRGRCHRHRGHRSRHDGGNSTRCVRWRQRAWHRRGARHRDHGRRERRRRARARLLHRSGGRRSCSVSGRPAREHASCVSRRSPHRLAAPRKAVDVTGLVADARHAVERSIGRPQIARAMIAAGHVADHRTRRSRAGSDAAVPPSCRASGASPESVIHTIHAARGLASLAHPGPHPHRRAASALRDAGLDALEAFHSDHVPDERDPLPAAGAIARPAGDGRLGLPR